MGGANGSGEDIGRHAVDATRWSRSVGLHVKCEIDSSAIENAPGSGGIAELRHEQVAAICMAMLYRVKKEFANGAVAPMRFSFVANKGKEVAELVAAFVNDGPDRTLVIRKT